MNSNSGGGFHPKDSSKIKTDSTCSMENITAQEHYHLLFKY